MDELALRAQVKAELRFRMRQTRKAIPHEQRQRRAQLIHQSIAVLPEWTSAETVLLYASMRAEVDTWALEASARQAGKRIGCPRMSPDVSSLDPRVWEAGVVPSEQGRMAPEPPENAPLLDDAAIDLILLPAVALDERGARIGYGRGLYDRLLARAPRALRVAVAFDFQLIAEVPETPGDERVDIIVTDSRVLRCPRRS